MHKVRAQLVHPLCQPVNGLHQMTHLVNKKSPKTDNTQRHNNSEENTETQSHDMYPKAQHHSWHQRIGFNFALKKAQLHYVPIASMYGMLNIKNQPNAGKHTSPMDGIGLNHTSLTKESWSHRDFAKMPILIFRTP